MSEDEKVVDAVKQMELAIERATADAQSYSELTGNIFVDRETLCRFLSEVNRLQGHVVHLQGVGSRLVYERQAMDRDRLSIAEKVRQACVAECRREREAAELRAIKQHIDGNDVLYERSDGQAQGAGWCEKHVAELDLAKVLGS